jgi:hypothetical protein
VICTIPQGARFYSVIVRISNSRKMDHHVRIEAAITDLESQDRTNYTITGLILSDYRDTAPVNATCNGMMNSEVFGFRNKYHPNDGKLNEREFEIR